VGVHAQVRGLLVVPGDVQVAHAVQRQPVEEIQRIVAVVYGVDDDVVHVEQQVAVGGFEHRGDELRLGHFRSRLRVVGDVLQRDAQAQLVLNDADALGDVAHRVLGEGNRHQVVEVAELVPAGGEVLGVIANAVGIQESAQIPQEIAVQGSWPPDVERQAVADEGLGLGPLAQDVPEGAPEVHPVLGGDFEKIHLVAGARCLRERAQKSPPQTQARTTNVGLVVHGHAILAAATAFAALAFGALVGGLCARGATALAFATAAFSGLLGGCGTPALAFATAAFGGLLGCLWSCRGTAALAFAAAALGDFLHRGGRGHLVALAEIGRGEQRGAAHRETDGGGTEGGGEGLAIEEMLFHGILLWRVGMIRHGNCFTGWSARSQLLGIVQSRRSQRAA
jgi:hypothetical protein